MRRDTIAPRADWRARVEADGLIWHTDGATPYWDEGSFYAFPLAEIELIEDATEELHRLFLAAGDELARRPDLLTLFGIPEWCHGIVAAEWKRQPPALNFGRFDLAWDGEGPPKLLEFNCDTPTSLLEAAVVQWNWKEDCFAHLDQLNSLHDRMVARWRAIAPRLPGGRAWFTHIADEAHEDTITTTYMREIAMEAGLETHGVVIDDIGMDAQGRVVDQHDQLITAMFKLYPWEWIVEERFGRDVMRNLHNTAWIEPAWKLLWSNKAVLWLLWQMFPGHPNLLPAALSAEDAGPDHVAKPFLAREGANVEVWRGGECIARSDGKYDGPRVYQQFYPLKDFGRGFPVLGSWIVDGAAAGLGIREDGLITGNRARFVPHVIEG